LPSRFLEKQTEKKKGECEREKKKQKNLKRRELRGRSSLFEKFGGGVE
jgi:hypothetical protein